MVDNPKYLLYGTSYASPKMVTFGSKFGWFLTVWSRHFELQLPSMLWTIRTMLCKHFVLQPERLNRPQNIASLRFVRICQKSTNFDDVFSRFEYVLVRRFEVSFLLCLCGTYMHPPVPLSQRWPVNGLAISNWVLLGVKVYKFQV